MGIWDTKRNIRGVPQYNLDMEHMIMIYVACKVSRGYSLSVFTDNVPCCGFASRFIDQ